MAKVYAIILLAFIGLVLPEHALAYSPLQCSNGSPEAGTSLFDDSSSGACQFTGLRYIFSTVVCQFVSMINAIMGKLYCSIQAAVTPIIMALMTVYVVVYGAQMVMGTAQLNGAEVITRLIKMCIVLWLATDPAFGVSAGINYVFNFFIAFISDTTRWVVKILDRAEGINLYFASPYDPGVTSVFKYLDDWIYNALTGTLSQANARVIGFFVAMTAAMPSIATMALYWLISLVKMLISTLMSFLMAMVAIAFLLGLSPIFISFMLFQATFSYFDQWLKFMVSYSIQVFVSFAILTLWIFSMTLFGPFFNQLSEVIFPYQKIIRPAAATYLSSDTWGLCPLTIYPDPDNNGMPAVRCTKANFNPQGSAYCDRQTGPRPCYYVINGELDTSAPINFGADPGAQGMSEQNDDYKDVIPPSKVPELNNFLFYLFYHLVSLLIVSYGFANLQKKSQDIATALGGSSYIPILNHGGHGFGESLHKADNESRRYMSKEIFSGFNRRHETQQTPYENMRQGITQLVSKR